MRVRQRQRQPEADRDRQRQTETDRDKQRARGKEVGPPSQVHHQNSACPLVAAYPKSVSGNTYRTRSTIRDRLGPSESCDPISTQSSLLLTASGRIRERGRK
eukprot:2865216-Rhodomonas_salina.2